MAKQFAALLRGNFLVAVVNVFYKVNTDAVWELMYGSKNKNCKYLTDQNTDRMQIEYFTNAEANVCVILPLIDKSVYGITISAKLDKSDFIEFDKIILQIFIQLIDNAYQSFLNKEKDKKLIFELNQRVLQLNNLIDTGIDLSKFENRTLLFELALQRVAVLTDSSTAMVQILKDKKLAQEIVFPPGFDSFDIVNSDNNICSSFTYHEREYRFFLINKESRTGIAQFTELEKILKSYKIKTCPPKY